jgi:sulfate/thiosulfate transport system permease protein
MPQRRILPGLPLSLGVTLVYVTLIIALPVAAVLLKAMSLSLGEFWNIVTSPRALSTYRITVLCALAATLFNAVFGFAFAWVLVRYDFPGKRLLDTLVDVPFALPTAVAGVTLTALFAKNGWFGAPLASIGIEVAYTPLGIIIAMIFTSLPFIVRTVQPVLEELDPEFEDAASCLGAGDLDTMRRVILPLLMPALLAGISFAFVRCLGEFGAIIFIAGNQPLSTEITSLLAFIRVEEFDYPGAAAIATVMLFASLAILILTSLAQSWYGRHLTRS